MSLFKKPQSNIKNLSKVQWNTLQQLGWMGACKINPGFEGKSKDKRCLANYAVQSKDFDILNILNQANLDWNVEDSVGSTPLFHAIHESHRDKRYLKCVDQLLSYGANIDYQNNRGMTALMFAVIRPGPFAKLLECGADWTLKNACGETIMDKLQECSQGNKAAMANLEVLQNWIIQQEKAKFQESLPQTAVNQISRLRI